MNNTVTYSLAKLLEEKGFDKHTQANWWILAKDHSENYRKNLLVDESKIFFAKDSYELELKTRIDEETEHNVYHVLGVPTIADVVMWLYEKHGIWISVHEEGCKGYIGFDFNIVFLGNHEKNIIGQEILYKNLGETVFNSPTEAYQAAILYTLNNLI